MIWLAGLVNSNPAMTDLVNPETMRLCLAVHNIDGEAGAAVAAQGATSDDSSVLRVSA